MPVKSIKSYSDTLALKWVEHFIKKWEGEPYSQDLREAIIKNFPGKISNIIFSSRILPGKLTFLYYSLDQKQIKKDLSN